MEVCGSNDLLKTLLTFLMAGAHLLRLISFVTARVSLTR